MSQTFPWRIKADEPQLEVGTFAKCWPLPSSWSIYPELIKQRVLMNQRQDIIFKTQEISATQAHLVNYSILIMPSEWLHPLSNLSMAAGKPAAGWEMFEQSAISLLAHHCFMGRGWCSVTSGCCWWLPGLWPAHTLTQCWLPGNTAGRKDGTRALKDWKLIPQILKTRHLHGCGGLILVVLWVKRMKTSERHQIQTKS